MTEKTGESIRLSLTTPNNFWSLDVPTIMVIGDFVSMTVYYEGLNPSLNWGIINTLENNEVLPNEQTISQYISNKGLIQLELEIREL